MDTCSYFSVASGSKPPAVSSSYNSDSDSDSDSCEPRLRSIAQVLVFLCPEFVQIRIRRYNKGWESTFPWLEFDEDLRVHSANYVRRMEDLFNGLVGDG